MTTTDQHEHSARVEFDVDGMTCGSCAARVEQILAHKPGGTDAGLRDRQGARRLRPVRG